MRRAVVSWVVAVALLAGVATAAVVVLNATAFGPAAFVRVYLDALGRGDAAGALSMPGVTVPEGDRADFLVDETLTGLAVDGMSVGTRGDGIHLVTVSWRTADGSGVSTFEVAGAGTRLGIFAAWQFAVSPVATLELAVEHDDRFELAGVPARSGTASSEPVAYALLVPGVYRVDHRSAYLRADAVDVVVDRPGSTVDAVLDVRPADAFVAALTEEVRAHLDECATQEVLFPTGCPFGHAIPNRVVSAPEWSIADYPEIAVEPGDDFGTWAVPAAAFTTHLRVEVQALFDGTISTFDEDLPSTAAYVVRILPDDATLRLEVVIP